MTADAAGNGQARPKGRSFLKTLLVVIVVAVVTSVATVWLTNVYLFPKAFTPVTLNHDEQAALDSKLQALDVQVRTKPAKGAGTGAGTLKPERYSEEGASREVTFTEREINALLANNTDLASKVAIDLSPNLISARIIVPIDPDMPVLGGKTLRMSAGLELSFKSRRPVVVVRGVSLWGVPLPNAWLGNIKNVDLIQAYGDEGFWKAFAAGIDNIAVEEGRLTIKLKE